MTPAPKRVLRAWDLVFYGIVLIQPVAPVGIFGLISKLSGGQAATTILLAMVAMTLTAWSYGKMAGLYPSAGSAYAYVSRGLNPHLGFFAGWAMFLDYLIIPMINVVYVALTLQRLVPQIPYAAWAALTAVAITLVNLRGIRFTARANEVLLFIMSAVVLAFVVLAVRFLLNRGDTLFTLTPFYEPRSFRWPAVATATSLAALTYIGFDGVTTLAEEVENPRRTVPFATVLVCLITGALSVLEVYLGQRVWPDYGSFPNLETAFFDVTGRVGGTVLFNAIAAVMVIACFASGFAGQAAAARLLYGMGRDRVLPPRLFGHLGRRSGSPVYNVILLGALAGLGAIAISYERAAELLNFGAFLAFMAVNAAVIRTSGIRVIDGIVAAAGFCFCFTIWISLPAPAKIAGGVWLGIGIVYSAIRTRGFRAAPAILDMRES